MLLPRWLVGVVILTAASAAAATRPNIVYILADDMGVGDVSALNAKSAWQTPHLDRLAKEGIAFTDAHSSSAVCTPSRYAIMTGRYNWRSARKSGVKLFICFVLCFLHFLKTASICSEN